MTDKERINVIREFFPDAHQTSNDYRNLLEQLITPIISLLPKNLNEDKALLGNSISSTFEISELQSIKLDEEGETEKDILKGLIDLFQGSPNWASALSMNIIHQSNKIGIISFVLGSIFSPNILEKDANLNIQKAEYEVGSMINDLAWADASESGCVFTYSSESEWIYAIQYGKARVLKNSSKKGLFDVNSCKVICSKVAKISKELSTTLTGIGTDNLIQISVDENNSMDLNELETVLQSLKNQNIPVACIIATLGTKNFNSFDSVKGIYDLAKKYPNDPEKFGEMLIYADTNLTFTWLSFKGYDFNRNPLGFGESKLPILKKIYDSIAEIQYADCFSANFHLSGYCPGNTSSFNFKNASEFNSLLNFSKLSEDSNDNDILELNNKAINFSLGALSAWATFKYFGRKGFRLLNGQQIEFSIASRNILNEEKNICTINLNDFDQTVLFRVYDDETELAKEIYEKELSDPLYKDRLKKNNSLNAKVYNKLLNWYRTGKQINDKYTPYIAYVSSIRKTKYNEQKEMQENVNCLKIYSSQFNATLDTINWLVKCINLAIDEIKKEESNN